MAILSDVERRRRRTYAILPGIVVLTVPCYCAGFSPLIFAPAPLIGTPTPLPPTPTQLFSETPTATQSASVTPGGPAGPALPQTPTPSIPATPPFTPSPTLT